MRVEIRVNRARMLAAAAMSLMLAACGGGGGTTEAGASPTAALVTGEPVSQVDPLEGEWGAEVTCQDSLRAIKSHLTPKQIRLQVGNLESAMGEWGGQPTKDDPCNGVHEPRRVVARFADGNLGLFNAETSELMADARYELIDDHSFRVGAGALCYPPLECPVTWKFDIDNDELTFQAGPEVFQVMMWEAAPFHRVG
jgi:hypothetical protein